jgi:hypothetical protein
MPDRRMNSQPYISKFVRVLRGARPVRARGGWMTGAGLSGLWAALEEVISTDEVGEVSVDMFVSSRTGRARRG